jgi:proteasome lid subunit RPN8/RPN11
MGPRISRVLLKPEVVEGLLEYAKANHPRECILLLRGRVKEGVVWVDQLVIPPGAVHGESMSTFNPHLLPLDATIIGVAHSHPTPNPYPSLQDLLHFYGKIALLVTYPYRSIEDVVAYDRDGRIRPCEVYRESPPPSPSA